MVRWLLGCFIILTLFISFFFLTLCFKQLMIVVINWRIGWLYVSSIFWFLFFHIQCIDSRHSNRSSNPSMWEPILLFKLTLNGFSALSFLRLRFRRIFLMEHCWASIWDLPLLARLGLDPVYRIKNILHGIIANWSRTYHRQWSNLTFADSLQLFPLLVFHLF